MRASFSGLLIAGLLSGCGDGGPGATSSGGAAGTGAAGGGGTGAAGGGGAGAGGMGTGATTSPGGSGGTGETGGTGAGGGASSGGSGGGGACSPGSIEPCYEGPPATRSVGLCTSGIHTCLPDGTGFDACVGAVLPGEETCLSAADEDCDGVDCAVWIHSSPGGSWIVKAVRRGPTGHVLVAADLQLEVDFGGQAFVADGSSDAFLLELDEAGQLIGARRFGGAGGDVVNAIDVAPDGSVLMAGYYNGTVDFGGVVLTGTLRGFLVVLDPDGSTRWALSLPPEAGSNAAVFAPDGDVVVASMLTGPADVGGGLLAPDASDVLVARFAKASGAHVWSKLHGGAANQVARALAASPAGGYVVAGTNAGALQAGPDTLTAAGGLYSAFVARMDETGELTSGLSIAEVGNASALVTVAQLAVDTDGNAYVTGTHNQGIDVDGPGPVPPYQPTAIPGRVYLARYSPTGQLDWHRFLGVTSQSPPSLAVSGPRVVVAGRYALAVDFGGGLVQLSQDVALATYDLTGPLRWVKVLPAVGGVTGMQVGPGPVPGTVYGAAYIGAGDALDLGKGPLPGLAAAVARFAP